MLSVVADMGSVYLKVKEGFAQRNLKDRSKETFLRTIHLRPGSTAKAGTTAVCDPGFNLNGTKVPLTRALLSQSDTLSGNHDGRPHGKIRLQTPERNLFIFQKTITTGKHKSQGDGVAVTRKGITRIKISAGNNGVSHPGPEILVVIIQSR